MRKRFFAKRLRSTQVRPQPDEARPERRPAYRFVVVEMREPRQEDGRSKPSSSPDGGFYFKSACTEQCKPQSRRAICAPRRAQSRRRAGAKLGALLKALFIVTFQILISEYLPEQSSSQATIQFNHKTIPNSPRDLSQTKTPDSIDCEQKQQFGTEANATRSLQVAQFHHQPRTHLLFELEKQWPTLAANQSTAPNETSAAAEQQQQQQVSA